MNIYIIRVMGKDSETYCFSEKHFQDMVAWITNLLYSDSPFRFSIEKMWIDV